MATSEFRVAVAVAAAVAAAVAVAVAVAVVVEAFRCGCCKFALVLKLIVRNSEVATL